MLLITVFMASERIHWRKKNGHINLRFPKDSEMRTHSCHSYETERVGCSVKTRPNVHNVIENYQEISARGVTTVLCLIPGCITSGCDWESHRAAHKWPSVARVGHHCKYKKCS